MAYIKGQENLPHFGSSIQGLFQNVDGLVPEDGTVGLPFFVVDLGLRVDHVPVGKQVRILHMGSIQLSNLYFCGFFCFYHIQITQIPTRLIQLFWMTLYQPISAQIFRQTAPLGSNQLETQIVFNLTNTGSV